MTRIARVYERLNLRRMAALPAGSLRDRYVRSAFWSITGTGLAQMLGLIAAVVVARLLGAERYGEMGMIRDTTATFGVFAGFGMGITATKYMAELRVTDPDRAGRVWGLIDTAAIGMSLLAAGLILLAAPFLADRLLEAPHLVSLLRLSVIVLVFNTLIGIQNAVLAGLEAFRQTAQVDFMRGVLYFPIMIVATYGWGLTGAVLGLGFVAVGGFIVGRLALRAITPRFGIRLKRSGAMRELGILWDFSLPAFASSMMLITGQWLCSVVLVRQPSGYVEKGLFTAAAQWTSPIMFLPMTLAGPSLSLLSNLYGEGDLRRFRKMVWASVGLVVAFCTVTALVVGVASPWLMRAYGREFAAGAVVLQLVCVMVVTRATARATSQVLVAMGRTRLEFGCSAVRIVAQVGLFVLVFLRWGAAGLAVALSVGFVLQLILQGSLLYGLIGRSRETF